MLRVGVTTNALDVSRYMRRLVQDQIPFATALALTRIAQDVKQAEIDTLPRVFDRPTPYTMNSVFMRPATKRELEAEVWLKDRRATFKGTPATEYLAPNVYGGDRSRKRMELALQRVGLLPAGMIAVPGAGANLDGYGNMARGEIVRILAWVGAFGEQGYSANMTAKSRARLAKGSEKRGVRGVEYFASRGPGNWFGARSWRQGRMQHLAPGIYKRTKFGFGQSIEPVLMFVRAPAYSKRFPFFEIAQRTFTRVASRHTRRATAEALATRSSAPTRATPRRMGSR